VERSAQARGRSFYLYRTAMFGVLARIALRPRKQQVVTLACHPGKATDGTGSRTLTRKRRSGFAYRRTVMLAWVSNGPN
jgi:hypothetical protein